VVRPLGWIGPGEEIGEWTTEDLAARIAIQRLRARAPGCNQAIGVDSEDCVGGGFPDGRQPALRESMLSRSLAHASRQPPGRCSGREQGRQSEQGSERLTRDKEEVQQPTDSGREERSDCETSRRPDVVQGRLPSVNDDGTQSEALVQLIR
jgi:hypothetical protein